MLQVENEILVQTTKEATHCIWTKLFLIAPSKFQRTIANKATQPTSRWAFNHAKRITYKTKWVIHAQKNHYIISVQFFKTNSISKNYQKKVIRLKPFQPKQKWNPFQLKLKSFGIGCKVKTA
jgi:hypothetical protein